MRILTVCAVLAMAVGGLAAADPNPLAARKETWQKTLDRDPFRFRESEANVLFALSQYDGDCQVHMIHDPKKWSMLTFKFVRAGKDVLSLVGHKGSVFRTVENVLYFAHSSTSSSGCTVSAHDLTSGKKLWETQLAGLGPVQHSAYRNDVTMGLASDDGGGIVSISGRESYGDYVEIMDRKTGTVLAHKVYRQGYAKPD